MHLPSFLIPLLHIFGLDGGNDSGTTTISTVDDYFSTRLASTVVYDTSTLAKIHSTKVSPKFISTLASTYSTADEIVDRSKTVTGTGITMDVKSTDHTVPSTTFRPTVTEMSSTASETTETGGSSTTSGTTETGSNTETDQTGEPSTTSGTTETGSNTETDQTTETGSTVTDQTVPDTTVTGETGSDTTITGVTGSETTVTGETRPDTTVSGADTTVTGQSGSTSSGSTDVTPTKAPGLSRGAVAGIVIGCLLLVAVIAAAVVFFMKNRNIPPEAQRLRV